jgi:hypothetical protein
LGESRVKGSGITDFGGVQDVKGRDSGSLISSNARAQEVWYSNRRDNQDDRDNDQQFNQSETAIRFFQKHLTIGRSFLA